MLGIWHINAVGDTEGESAGNYLSDKGIKKITKAAKGRTMSNHAKKKKKNPQDCKRGELSD